MRSYNGMWTAYRRGIQRVSSCVPRLLTFITLHNTITAVTPYVTVWLISRIVSELCGEKDPHTILMRTVTALIVGIILSVIGSACKRIKEAKWECLYRSVNGMTADKMLSLDHTAVGEARTQDLYARVKEHTNELGMGLVQIPDSFQHLIKGLVGTVTAVVVTAGLFADTPSSYPFLDSPLTAVACVLTLVGITVAASRLSAAATRMTDTGTSKVVALDRAYYSLYNMMFDPSKAADIRLYRQDKPIAAHLRQTDTAFFDKGGLKRRPLRDMLYALADGLPIWWLGMMYLLIALKALDGAFGLDSTLLYLSAVTFLIRHVGAIRDGIEKVRRNTPYVQTALAFLAIKPRMYRGSLTTEKRADRDYTLTFRHVSFTYPAASSPALTRVNTVLTPGKRIAVVGENGSGKSTFVKLLARLYDPDEGDILLNDIDIRKYRREDYIDLISVVFQDHRLLDGPIGDNVAGCQVYDRQQVLRCLEEAGYTPSAHTDDDILQQPTASLSSGDVQKIAIARALYKNAPIIILDEPTAALDPVTEAEIYARLDRIVDDRTAVFISHRLSSCRFCDEILVFDGGTVVQRGTHEELLRQPQGKYYALWHAQAQYYQ